MFSFQDNLVALTYLTLNQSSNSSLLFATHVLSLDPQQAVSSLH